ncbi:MAG: flagellar motor switch protein FliG [Nitrospinota bacterium]
MTNLSGPEKAAILLIAIGDEQASKILSNLTEREIQKISSYMSSMPTVPKNAVKQVTDEFAELIQSGDGGYVSGGKDYLKRLLETTVSSTKASEILDRITTGNEDIGGGLETLRTLDAATIASFLRNEHPQTCAIILAYIDSGHAAEVLKELPEKFQSDVVFRVATLERIAPGVIKELDEALAHEFRSANTGEGSKIGGADSVAKILNYLDQTIEGSVLGNIESTDPELAENIRKLMFVFEDLIKINDRGLQNVIKEVNSNDLMIALKTASKGLKEKIYSNMTERAAVIMKEDLEAMGPIKISDVEKAQQNILKMVKQLEGEGKVILVSGGEKLV